MKKTFLLMAVLLVSILSLRANNDIYLEYLKNTDGLPNNTVTDIYQDSKGFVWLCTLNGVSRYDGYTFMNFFPKQGEGISLADRRVKSVQEDSHKFLWFTTSIDLISCYDLRNDRFVDFTGCGEYKENYGYYKCYPEETWLWGRHNGCRRITYKNGGFSSEKFNTKNKKLKSDYISFLKRDSKGRIWIGTQRGLYVYESGDLKCVNADNDFIGILACADGKVVVLTADWKCLLYNGLHLLRTVDFHARLGGLQLTGDLELRDEWVVFTNKKTIGIDIHTLQMRELKGTLNIHNAQSFKDAKGLYWLYDRMGRLSVVSPATGEVKTFLTTLPYMAKYLGDEHYNVEYDKDGIAWITSNISGIYSYNFHTREFRHYDGLNPQSALIRTNAIQCLLIDRSGGYWFGTDIGMFHLRKTDNTIPYFYVFPPSVMRLKANDIRMLTRLTNGHLLIGNKEGVVYTYNSLLTNLLSKGTYERNIYAVSLDKNGIIWKASRGAGLFIGNKQYKNIKGDGRSLGSNQLFCLLRDSKDRMWIGTFGKGLDLAIPQAQGAYSFRHFFTESYAQSQIRSLIQDRNGWIWMGTSDGVYLFHPDDYLNNGKCFHYLSGFNIKQIMEDSKGNVYLSEAGVGFAVSQRAGRDYAHLKLKQFSVADGLVNSTIQAFVEDKNGNIWITTENGISCFDPPSKLFNNYFFSSDVERNNYNESAACCLDDGRLAFGTSYGIVVFDPSRLKKQSAISPVVFTNLMLNRMAEEGNDFGGEPSRLSLAYTENVSLPHDQNSFIINFSTLDYPISPKPQYSYLLENYDKTWSIPSTLHFAEYKNLSPGHYKLRVKVRNEGGAWSKESVMDITITPPFWLTPWAYLLYLLLGIVACYHFLRIVNKMNRLRNKVEVERQLTEYKLAFFTNISHEFRTPLTLIQSALERFSTARLYPESVSSVKMMAKSTQRLMRLVDQLMDFRKIEKNKLKLALERMDSIAFIKDICMNFKERATLKKIDFTFHSEQSSYEMYIDKEKFDKIIYNLLSNAFKYTPKGGKIEVRVNICAPKTLTMEIKDSGVGIPKEKQKEMFQPFMQSRFSGHSVGIGLHLSQELVTALKGKLSYKENPEGGSIFTVTLPTDEKEYRAEDFLSEDSALLKEEERQRKDMLNMGTNLQGDLMSANEMSDQKIPINKRRVLVIEDDDDIRLLLQKELSSYFEVAVEADGKSGLEYAINNDVDMIVCDVMMPGLSGFEVTNRLKSDFATSHIPIILLTALGDADHYLKGIERGADAYITKPFSIRLLLVRISRMIEQRDKLREKFSRDTVSVRPLVCTTDEEKKFADRLAAIVENEFDNPDFTVNDFASAMSLGRTILYKKVKGLTGYTPMEYIRIIRMKKAAQFLLDSDVKISEVAYRLGMDPLYFSHCFKAQFGVSPLNYQKSGGVHPEKTGNEQ